MRSSSNHRKKEGAIPWKWIIVVIIIFSVLYFLRGVGSSSETESGEGIIINGSGSFVVTKKDGTKKDLKVSDTFYRSDASLSVISGMAELKDAGGVIWIDKNSEISQNETNTGGYLLPQGRMWVEATGDMNIGLKHIDIALSSGDVLLLEQQRIYSIAYVLRGDAIIRGNGREATMKAGKRIMVSQSNLINPSVTLESLMGDIDESIQQNAFFLSRNGKSFIDSISNSIPSENGSGTIGSLVGSGSAGISGSTNKFVSISNPLDGAVITGGVLTVEGRTLSAQVKKIVINDQNIQVTTSPGTFRSTPISITTSTYDLVYRAYDGNNNLLERGVLTLYANDKTSSTEKLIPKTFPTNDKDFRILSPNENPYKTNLSAVTVSGTVPKGAVEYITVNNFRLKKFVPKSTTWYYYANVSYQTMKEGFNLYEIRFYGENDTLLSTQLFTIIKEGERSVSGEL